jgi:hypothetical protein
MVGAGKAMKNAARKQQQENPCWQPELNPH